MQYCHQCPFFVQLFKCMRDSMELEILTGTLGALTGEHPYGSEQPQQILVGQSKNQNRSVKVIHEKANASSS